MLASPRNRLGYNNATNFQCYIPLLGVSRRSSVSGECPGLPATMVYKPPHATSAAVRLLSHQATYASDSDSDSAKGHRDCPMKTYFVFPVYK